MNCVPVCVKTIIRMLVCSVVICGTLAAEFLVAWRYDKEWRNTWKLAEKRRIAYFEIVMVLCSIYVCPVIRRENSIVLYMIGIILGSLLMAAITDYYTCQVYCFVWWVAGVALCVLLFIKHKCGILVADVSQLAIFCLLQELLFGKMYGRADCHAFCVSALLLWCLGGDIKIFLMHMAVSFLLLAIVQAFRKNINRRGNLKQPVAFVPYIVFALCLLLGTI